MLTYLRRDIGEFDQSYMSHWCDTGETDLHWMQPRWILSTLHLRAFQARVFIGDSGLCRRVLCDTCDVSLALLTPLVC